VIENVSAVESIAESAASVLAETMIETDTIPYITAAAPLSLILPSVGAYIHSWDEYLPIHLVSEPPRFDERAIRSIRSALEFEHPPVALRSGIEGRVILELFVDRYGVVQRIRIVREDPEGWGFGEAAVRAFTGRHAIPAYANGEPVPTRLRYPVIFGRR
jgi:hypothetical protein